MKGLLFVFTFIISAPNCGKSGGKMGSPIKRPPSREKYIPRQ